MVFFGLKQENVVLRGTSILRERHEKPKSTGINQHIHIFTAKGAEPHVLNVRYLMRQLLTPAFIN
jgi:hypothetical protein